MKDKSESDPALGQDNAQDTVPAIHNVVVQKFNPLSKYGVFHSRKKRERTKPELAGYFNFKDTKDLDDWWVSIQKDYILPIKELHKNRFGINRKVEFDLVDDAPFKLAKSGKIVIIKNGKPKEHVKFKKRDLTEARLNRFPEGTGGPKDHTRYYLVILRLAYELKNDLAGWDMNGDPKQASDVVRKEGAEVFTGPLDGISPIRENLYFGLEPEDINPHHRSLRGPRL